MPTPKPIRGFTLVELSVVIVIVGLVLSMGISVANTQLQATLITNTKQKAIRLASINFISQNNRLPCPAVATLPPGSAGYGQEAANPGVCTSTTVNTDNTEISTGIVPWTSLGISEDTASVDSIIVSLIRFIEKLQIVPLILLPVLGSDLSSLRNTYR